MVWQISKPYGPENKRKENNERAPSLDIIKTTKVAKTVQKLYRHSNFISVFQRYSPE